MKAIIILFALTILSFDPVISQSKGYKMLLIRERNKEMNYVVDAKYPALTASNTAVNIINRDIDAFVRNRISEFKTEVRPVIMITDTVAVNNFDLKDSVYWTNDHLVSIELLIYKFLNHEAHPADEIVTLNYDMRNGNRLQLDDLFKPGYLDVIADYAHRALIADFSEFPNAEIDREWLSRGTQAVDDNYKNYLLSNNGVTIVFNTYQVAPYYFGPRRAFIPYLALSNYWDYSSAVGGYLR